MPAALELLMRGEHDATKELTVREIATLRVLLERVAQSLAAVELEAPAAPDRAPPRPRRAKPTGSQKSRD